MPSPFYRQSNSMGGGGAGVSEAGGKGALALFGEIKSAVCDTQPAFLPTHAEEAAAAKAAADAYTTAKTGFSPLDSVGTNSELEIPDLKLSEQAAPGDLGKAIQDMISSMGEVLNQAFANPIGFISSLLSFLLKAFSEIVTSTLEMLNEFARAAAAAIEEATKKQLAAVQSGAGLQSLELFTSSATTQTLATALSTPGT